MIKRENIENTVVDEANERTYVVMAKRILTDGEMYSAIRVALMQRGHEHVQRGQTLTIDFAEKA